MSTILKKATFRQMSEPYFAGFCTVSFGFGPREMARISNELYLEWKACGFVGCAEFEQVLSKSGRYYWEAKRLVPGESR